jgi:hypothetical protein
MIHDALQKLKAGFWSVSPLKTQGGDPGSPFFSSSEIALLRRQLGEHSDLAAEAASRAGVKLHPRVAAVRAKLGASY